MKVKFFAVLMLAFLTGYGQSPQVPSKMEFAGIKLRITEAARKEIQKDVDALTSSPKYYEIKAEKARSYFPIIERIFDEENLPNDFKYLVLQESALIPDAVSSSNAVGFWQFKDFTAAEVGLKINRNVDERMNIVSSSVGAARYLKKNNSAFFNNWLHALQAYQSGAGAALKVLDSKHRGAKSMVVDKKTYWYVKKYLAHKVAFSGVADRSGRITLEEYYTGAGKSLKEIANETGVEVDDLTDYNKWLRKGRIPDDKAYVVIIPRHTEGLVNPAMIAKNASQTVEKTHDFESQGLFPKIKDREEAEAGMVVNINGLPGIIASKKDKIPSLAKKGNVELSKFLKYNDLKIDDRLVPYQVYYLKAKRGKAKTYQHVVNYDETLWDISQKYGIKLKKLIRKNRITQGEKIKPGRVLWLRYIRPASTAIEYQQLPQREVPKEVIVNNTVEEMLEEEKAEVETEDVEPFLIEQETDTIPIIEIKDTINQIVDTVVLDTIAPVEELVAIENANNNEIENKNINKNKPSNKTSVKTHVVEAGQTYYAISKLYGVGVMEILEWNGIDINDKLSIGQELVINQPVQQVEPGVEVSTKAEEEFSLHVVKEGEGLYSIARSYDVTIQEVMDWNNKENFEIKVGEELKIKKKLSLLE